MNKKQDLWIVSLCALVLALSPLACERPTDEAWLLEQLGGEPTATPDTAATLDTPTLKAGPTERPPATPQPTATSSPPTFTGPVLAGTPVPRTAGPITTENASQVQDLSRWSKGAMRATAYSPDEQTIAAGSTVGIYLLDAVTLEERAFWPTGAKVIALAYSLDGATLASAESDFSVRVLSVPDGSAVAILYGHTDSVTSVAFAPDGTSLATGSLDGTVRVFRLVDGKAKQTIAESSLGVRCVAVCRVCCGRPRPRKVLRGVRLVPRGVISYCCTLPSDFTTRPFPFRTTCESESRGGALRRANSCVAPDLHTHEYAH